MTSSGHEISQNFELHELCKYFSLSIDQLLKMWDTLVAIFLLYSTFGTTYGKNSL